MSFGIPRFSRPAAYLALAALLGCAEPLQERGVSLHSFAVGVFDSNGNFTPSDVVPHETGGLFGYELNVHSTSGKVHVREVLDLPEAGVWSDNDTAPAGVSVLQERATDDGKQHIEEYEIECGDKMARFGQVYEIVEGDPAGTYKFTIYIDGQLAQEVPFRVEKTN